MNDSTTFAAERRHNSRQSITAYVELGSNNGGMIVDASEAGFRVQPIRELDPGVFVTMRFQPNRGGVWTEARGRVVWSSRARKLAGIEFADPPERRRELFRGLLLETSWRRFSGQSIRESTVFLSKSRALDRSWRKRIGGALKAIAHEMISPSTTSTLVLLAVLLCALVIGLLVISRFDLTSRVPPPAKTSSTQNPVTPESTDSAAGVSVFPSEVTALHQEGAAVSPSDSSLLPAPSPRNQPGTVLQVAVMNRANDATGLVETLKGSNFPAFVFHPNGERSYKVYIGPYGDPQSVAAMKRQLAKQQISFIEKHWTP